jgi:fluoride exporter
MYSYLLVMAGGAAGAALRFGLSRAVPMAAGMWPWATFAANVLGSLAMGILAFWLVRKGAQGEQLKLLLGVGLLGGFTTFSAFSLEVANMIGRGQIIMAFGYALASVLLALTALFAGMAVAKAVWA